MGATCMGSKPGKDSSIRQKTQYLSKQIDFTQIIKKVKHKYANYTTSSKKNSQNPEQSNLIIQLQQQVRNIFMQLINEKLMLLNENKISLKQCKIQIAQQLLQVQLLILKNVHQQKPDLTAQFLQLTDEFLIRLCQFLKTLYPRGQNIQAGQLAKTFKQFDATQQFQYDILKNAGYCFDSTDDFKITNTIKLFINTIITQLDTKFKSFTQLVEGISPQFKIGRKISQNTSKYFTLNTGTIQINSRQIARVLIKWMQDLTQMINQCEDKINAKNDYKFYKHYVQQDRIQFTKCQSATFNKILNAGFINDFKNIKKGFQQKKKKRIKQFQRFNVTLVKMLNQVIHNQSQVSTDFMEVIKFSYNNNAFIYWMVEEQLIQAIKCLVQISSEQQQFRGVLDIIKFKINDLMRCLIFGTRTQLISIFQKFRDLQKKNKLQIVKIKNRFNQPMSDAMIFFKLPGSFIICQCQLILAQKTISEDRKTTKNIQTVNHFLYQLQRAPFGVLGQISVFLTSKAEAVSGYSDKIKLSLKDKSAVDLCQKKHRNSQKSNLKQKQQKTPFVCSKCFVFYPKYSNKYQIHRCNKKLQKCNINVCNKCQGNQFKIINDYIEKSLNQKLDENKEQFQKTKLYKDNKRQFDFTMSKLTAQNIIKQKVFVTQDNGIQIMRQLKYIKEKFKNGKVKAQFIIKYIVELQNFQTLYVQTDLRFNFVVVTWKGGLVRFKCYRYDHHQNIIFNAYQQLQRYQTYENFDLNQFDIFYQVKAEGKCNFKQRNILNRSSYKAKQILQKGLYIFQGQDKRKMLRHFQNAQQIQRDQLLLINFEIRVDQPAPQSQQQIPMDESKKTIQGNDKPISQVIINEAHHFHLIVDVIKSIKRSENQDKMAQYLQELARINQFKKHIALTNMNIQDYQLKSLQTNSGLKWIQNIKSLNLNNNNISDMATILSSCKKLQKLQINHNNFKILSFSNALQYLTELDASQNRIQCIDYIQNISRIQVLNLKSNFLKKFRHKKKSFFSSNKLEYLRELNLAENDIVNLDQFTDTNIFFPNLTYLNLNENQITKLQKIMLPKIQQLNLSSNQIKNAKQFAEVYNPTLTKLYLQNNALTKLPKLNLPNLLILNITYNQFDDLDDFSQGEYFQNLSTLHVSFLDFKKLPKLGANLKIFSLQRSNLSDQDLEYIFNNNQLGRLKQLYLTRNNLTILPNIDRLTSLKFLCLDQNPISNIQKILSLKQTNKQDKKPNKFDSLNAIQSIATSVKTYKQLQRLWLSLKCDNQEQFYEARHKIIKIMAQKQPVQGQENNQNNQDGQDKIICWRYNENNNHKFQNKEISKLKALTYKNSSTKQILPKRYYLLDILQSQKAINDRFKKRFGVPLYELCHQWINIDINDFIRYDWKQLVLIDLRGAGLNDKKWLLFLDNADKFPNLKELHLWDNKIQTVPKGSLQKFNSLQLIDFYKVGWQYRISAQSKKYLKDYKKNNPYKFVNFA